MTLKTRLDRLEAVATTKRTWFDLEIWKRETLEGVPPEEQERRRLEEYPEFAEVIREHFDLGRRQLAAIAALPELPLAFGMELWRGFRSEPVKNEAG